jgi:hypothetical protein
MKFGKVMPLKVTLKPYFLTQQLQPFQNINIQTSEVEARLEAVHVGP